MLIIIVVQPQSNSLTVRRIKSPSQAEQRIGNRYIITVLQKVCHNGKIENKMNN